MEFARTFVLLITGVLLSTLVPSHGHAGVDPINKDANGLSARGYDVVAYFLEGKPVLGDESLTFEWMGATWLFTSKTNRDLFIKSPPDYAPQFGGYCAYAVGNNYTANGDPLAWSIVEGKLYLNYNASVRKTWLKDAATLIAKGNANWPALVGK